MNIKLLFVSLDEVYINSLSRFFVSNYDFDYEVLVAYNREDLVGELENFGDNTFCLIDEKMYFALKDDLVIIGKLKAIILSDELTNIDFGEVFCIFKYQNARNICEGINEYIRDNLSGEIVNKLTKKADLYVFYSPVSFSGNTLISECFAYIKSREGKNVLYLSFDSFSKLRFEGDSSFTSSDFFSSISTSKNIIMELSRMKASFENIDYLLPFDYELDKTVLNEINLKEVLTHLINSSAYDCICLDLNKSYFLYLDACLEISKKIVISIGNQMVATEKYLKFTDEIKKIYKEKYDSKFISIFNKLSKDRGIVECDYALGYEQSLCNLKVFNDSVLSSGFAKNLKEILSG